MYTNNTKICASYKPANENISYHGKPDAQNCKECVYFSSRNCGMDLADSIEPDLDIYI